MKHLMKAILIILLIGHGRLWAQVSINTDGSQPDPSAMLDIKSTGRGLLVPRMTSVQRLSITSPADGLCVYDSTAKQYFYYMAGTGWQQFLNGASAFALPYSGTFSSPLSLFSLTNTGTGNVGYFQILNASNDTTALEAVTNGTGSGAIVSNMNAFNLSNTLSVVSNGAGSVYPRSLGNAGNFYINNTDGVGAGVRGETNSIFGNEGTAGIYGVASGTGGYGGYFEQTSSTGYGMAMQAMTAAQGVCAHFESTAAGNAQPTVQVVTDGTGEGMDISNTLSSNTNNVLNVTSIGNGVIANPAEGNAGNFFANNTEGIGAGVRGETNSIFGNKGAAGVYGVASGPGGYGGYFEETNSTGYGLALQAMTSNQGVCAHFESTAAGNAQPTVQVVTDGTGEGMDISNTLTTSTSSTSNVLNVTSIGNGSVASPAVGNAGNFFSNNTNGIGAGVRGETNSIFGNEGAAGVYGVSSGTGGYAGYFEHTNNSGYGIGVYIQNAGIGQVLVANSTASSGDLGVFQVNGGNVARISHTGKGYFDGGTQNSGADLAEAFDVEGSAADYEPGDVLLISTTADRTLVKSNEAYSNLVAGIYATKPGVLLTEESVNSSLAGKVPMGVVGVIPTKVCNDGGPIHRGDILVTSARPGYAMKADLNKLKPGQAIGKALEEFNDTTGKIKVLVNVK